MAAILASAPIVKQELAKTGALNSLEELLGDNLVGVDVGAIEWGDVAVVLYETVASVLQTSWRAGALRTAGETPALRYLLKFPVSDVGEMSGDGRRRCHHRTDQMSASTAALAAFEVAIAGRSAAFAGLQDVRIHPQTHRASRFAPFKAGLSENPVEAFCSASCFTACEPGTTIARTLEFTWWPRATRAAARKSSRRELVHDPIKTRSIAISSIARPRFETHVVEHALGGVTLGIGFQIPSSSGTRPLTATTMPGICAPGNERREPRGVDLNRLCRTAHRDRKADFASGPASFPTRCPAARSGDP